MKPDMHGGLLRRAGLCNNFSIRNYLPLLFRDRIVGFVRRSQVQHLRRYTDLVSIMPDRLELLDGSDFQPRLSEMVDDLRERHIVNPWKGDKYAVSHSDKAGILFEVDRGASVFFGFFAYGTHLNGYRMREGKLELLLSRRAAHLRFAPNAIDTLAGGALPLGKTPTSNLANEALEETGMSAHQCGQAKACGTISYWWEQDGGVVPDTVYVFDIELFPDWTPLPLDNESGGFFYKDAQDVLEMLNADELIKDNSALVIIDFLIRHGVITANLPNYHQIVGLLHIPMNKYDELLDREPII